MVVPDGIRTRQFHPSRSSVYAEGDGGCVVCGNLRTRIGSTTVFGQEARHERHP